MNTHTLRFLVLSLSLLASQHLALAYQAGNSSGQSIFGQLNRDEEVLDITIETDLQALIDDRKRDDYQPATLTYSTGKKSTQSYEVKVKPRGKFRRRVCDFPPVKIKFAKADLRLNGLQDFNDLKLVTHCADDKELSRRNVVKEYLAYKMYNELTEYSFRAQLVQVTYIDSKGTMAKIRRYGILLEDKEELAARLGAELCDNCISPSADELMPGTEPVMAMFQYFIGNADWSLAGARNLEMLRDKATGKIIPVAYDFDFSGLVNAHYATPNADHKLISVRDRIYLGLPASDTVMAETLATFQQRSSALFSLVKKAKLLPIEDREDLRGYIQAFYDDMDALALEKKTNWFGHLGGAKGTGVISQDSMLAK